LKNTLFHAAFVLTTRMGVTDRGRHRLCLLLMLAGALLIAASANASFLLDLTSDALPRFETTKPELPGWPVHHFTGDTA
jgi:hypothetical protein